MAKLDSCQDLQHHRRAFFVTCFTSASLSKIEEQTPPTNKPAEEAGELADRVAEDELPEDEATTAAEPSEPPLPEFSQHGSSRLPSASKALIDNGSIPSKRQQRISPL